MAVLSAGGCWLPRGLSFGPTNGPEDFQELVFTVFQRKLYSEWHLFIDDLSIAAGRPACRPDGPSGAHDVSLSLDAPAEDCPLENGDCESDSEKKPAQYTAQYTGNEYLKDVFHEEFLGEADHHGNNNINSLDHRHGEDLINSSPTSSPRELLKDSKEGYSKSTEEIESSSHWLEEYFQSQLKENIKVARRELTIMCPNSCWNRRRGSGGEGSGGEIGNKN